MIDLGEHLFHLLMVSLLIGLLGLVWWGMAYCALEAIRHLRDIGRS
jgi:hypothetical protein